ncbi:MAG: hypothetical protein ACRDRS_02980 [Pseudonocardiaceae bacterium]
MSEVSRPVPSVVDEFLELFERRDNVEVRLARARDDQPLACALVMAALCWDHVNRRGWRAPKVLCAQARRLMTVWEVCTDAVDDAGQVNSALEWARRDPALLECDDQGRYRPVYEVGFPAGSRFWRDRHRAAVAAGVLTPLERVITGDADRFADPPDFDAAEVSYRLALDSGDQDAAALASLRLAELAEERGEQSEEVRRRYAEVAALRQAVASPPAVLWLARHAARNGDRPAARDMAHEVINSDAESLRAQAWDLVASLAWGDEDPDEAVAAMRLAVDTAGAWHWSYSRRLAEMLAASGELADAAEVYRTLLDQPLFQGPDAGRYVQLMVAAGHPEEAVVVLEKYAASDGPFAGDLLLALASAHAACDDLEGCRGALARVRAHWSATLPEMAVRADVMEASLLIVEGDDKRAAQLFRSLTDTDDAERRELARPLLIATGESFASDGKLCVIPGALPLLEYLSEAAAPATAAWAATSLAHLATVQDRPDDAEAAVRLAARHLGPTEVTVLRALLLDRAGRGGDAVAYLVDAAVAATPPALIALLLTITVFAKRGFWPDTQQRRRLSVAVDHVLTTGPNEDDDLREHVAMVMAQLERCAIAWEGGAVAKTKGKPRGKQPKLPPAAQRAIAARYATGEVSLTDLAQEYSVSRSTIHRVIQRQWITPD